MHFDRLERREFIALIGGMAAAWPLAARAQQAAMPVVGFLHASSARRYAAEAAAFQQGLRETRYFEGQNVAIEYRWADGHYDRLPALAADLVRRHVAVIAAGTLPAAVAAKEATNTIPIVFELGADPVRHGLVRSLNQPGGNVTGVVNLSNTLVPKRVQLIREVAPNAELIAVLLNPDNPNFQFTRDDVQAAQKLLGIRVEFLEARTISDIDASFTKVAELRAGALVVGPDGLFTSQWERFAALATRYGVPAIHELAEFAKAGGLMSYGADLANAYRLAGIYTGRILKGDKPGDLPIQQATKVELIINLKTAKALGLTMPPTLLALANEVIE
jgi:putative ABC transport system substrate-binding protein